MLATETYTDDATISLEFGKHGMPRIGVQIGRPVSNVKPFNLFWWGSAKPLELVGFSREIFAESLNAGGDGTIRFVQHGETWSDELDQPLRDFLGSPRSTVDLHPELYLLRIEYHPNVPPQQGPDAQSRMVIWARFGARPAAGDRDAIENMGTYLPLAEFQRGASLIFDFVSQTSIRAVRRDDFTQVLTRIGGTIPSL